MKRELGFTVTEMLVVTSLVAILLGIGVPSYRYITNSYRLSAEVNGLLGDFQFTRSEALREGQSVTICVSADGATCSGTVNWQSGWLVFANPTNAANPPAGSILRMQAPFLSVAGATDTFVANNGVSFLTYNREGFALGAAGTTVTLHDPSANSQWTRCLLIAGPGLASTTTYQTSVQTGAANCGP